MKTASKIFLLFAWSIICFLMGAAAQSAFGQSPASELKAAYADASRLKGNCATVRYLSLYTVPTERRAKVAATLGYVLNSLSRTRVIAPISKDAYLSDTLVRIDFANYTVAPDEFKSWYNAWEGLAFHDSTWHIVTETLEGGKKARRSVEGGWIGLEEAAKLRALTGSGGAILRADYFVTAASQPPYYYDFAGIPPTVDEFYKALGLDQKTIEALRANAAANLIQSGITLKDRHIQWSQGPLGGVYATFDTAQVTADRSPIRRPINAFGTDFVFDAGEYIAVGPNGLFRWALYDAKGKRQNSVPDTIAKDTSDPHGPGIVYAMSSCVRCHAEDGLKSFRDDQQDHLANLRGYDAGTVVRIHELYDDARFKRQMEFDRATYAAACLKASGLNSKELSKAMAETVREYTYLPIGLEQVARECGVTVDEFRYANNETRDPYIIALCNGRKVLRGQWSSSEAEAQLACATHIRRVKK